jgi:hypothetical protein
MDSFNRAVLNPPGSLLWLPVTQELLPVGAPFSIPAFFCDGASSSLVLSCWGQNNATYNPIGVMPCAGLTFSAVNGQTQYIQVVYNGVSAVNAIGGPCVMLAVNGNAGMNCYMLTINGTGANVPRLVKSSVAGNLFSQTVLGGPYAALNVGDVIRISCQVGVSNTLRYTRNGVLIDTQVDAAPLVAGLPGFEIDLATISGGVNGQLKLQSLDCGLGL